jgi:ribosome-associated protein
VRQARKDRPAPDADAVSRGLAPRQGRAYREIFQLVREQLAAADGSEPTTSKDDDHE